MLQCAKRKREQVKFVGPPKEILLSFSCVQFLTNHDVRKRKQHIGLTISCELKTAYSIIFNSYSIHIHVLVL